MAFPNKKELDKVRKKLEKVDGFKMLDPDASELDRFRFDICQEILKYSLSNNLNTTEMAEFLGITKADMSRIFNHRIDKFSTDKLIRLLEVVKPKYKLAVG